MVTTVSVYEGNVVPTGSVYTGLAIPSQSEGAMLPLLNDGNGNLKVIDYGAISGENSTYGWLNVVQGVQGNRVKRTFDWSGAVSATAIWTPAAGKRFVITDVLISASAACVVTLVDGNSGTDTVGNATTEGSRIGKYNLAANGGATEDAEGYYSLAANNSLYIITSAAGGSIRIYGYEI